MESVQLERLAVFQSAASANKVRDSDLGTQGKNIFVYNDSLQPMRKNPRAPEAPR